jgi:hypothetical protein
MTKEYAIECVQSFIDTFEICKENHEPIETSINGEDVIAFKMAIEALQQEPKETEYWDNKRVRGCDLCGKEMKEGDEVYTTNSGYVYCCLECLAYGSFSYKKVKLTDELVSECYTGWDE